MFVFPEKVKFGKHRRYMINFQTELRKLHAEITASIERVDPQQIAALIAMVKGSRRIACYGVGREGLILKGLAMRLYHLGFQSSVVGDMTAFPVGPEDLLVVSAGPGYFATVDALRRVAQEAGAKVFSFTAQPGGKVAEKSDARLVVPAQTAADRGKADSVLPMGSLYELTLFTLCELIVAALFAETKTPVEDAFSRHTNLE
jgi:6-phospho-3-hexuloisomerase